MDLRTDTPTRKRRLLVVEDEVPVQQAIEMFFMHHGFGVTNVSSGRAALQALDDEAFDLMVLDLILPDVDGMMLLEEVRAKHPRLPVIIFTGLGFDEGLLQEARKRGAAGFVSKELSLKQLLFEVRRVLDYR